MHTTEHDSPRSTPAVNSSTPSTAKDPKTSKDRKLLQREANEEVDPPRTMHDDSRGTPSSSVAAEKSSSPSTEPHANQRTRQKPERRKAKKKRLQDKLRRKQRRQRDRWRRQDSEPDVIRLPRYQRELRCMRCAGFVKCDGRARHYGCRYPRLVGWKEDDIRAFYSRAAEAFGVSLQHRSDSRFRYLFKDSLACTLKNKFQYSSRAKVYKRLGHDLGGWPVLSENRPWLFRNDRPVPFKIQCTNRSRTACNLRPTSGEE